MPDLASRILAVVRNEHSPYSIGGRARTKRWEELRRRFPDISSMRVIDLGGDARAWEIAPVRPQHVVLLNLGNWTEHDRPEWMSFVEGDACNPPREVTEQRFDLVYSNSLIEHLGGPAQRRRFADVVHALAPHHWVQTPYRYFPIEPHWVFPGFQFLPLPARVSLARNWPLSFTRGSGKEDATASTLSIELLTVTEMRHLFPDSEIYREPMAGMTKSLVAIR